MECKLKQNFVFALLKLIAYVFSAAPVLPLIASVGPSPNTRKLLLLLSVWDDEVLSTPKITTFLAKSLPKLHEPSPSNATLQPLQENLLSLLLLTMLTVSNKQFYIGKLLVGLRGQLLNL